MPLPDGPTMASVSPARTVKETSCRTASDPSPARYSLVSSRTTRIGAVDSATGTDMRIVADGRGGRAGRATGRAATPMWAALLAIGVLAGCRSGAGEGAAASRDSVRSNETPVATGSSGATADPPTPVAVPGADPGVRGLGPMPAGSSVDMRPVEGRPLRVLFIGTSLTAGLGLPDAAQQAWPAEVGRLAAAAGEPIEVVNAGLSGETSAGAVRRVNWLLRDSADVIVIETGANDGLRGLPVADLERNLRAIVAQARAKQPRAALVLVPMEAPPNIGGAYAAEFRGVYERVAKELGVPLTPFLLDGVAGVSAMNQADGIHPTERGATRAARNVWPALARVLAARREGRGAV